MSSELIRKSAAERLPLAVEARKRLHAIPEPSNAEFETTSYISEFLSARAIVHQTTSTGTGILAYIGEGEDNVLLRADIDALPVLEETGLEHCSVNRGMMHACGHDVHAAILLAVADALAADSFPTAGRTILLFQPAEEGHGGMRTLIREGLLDKIHPKTAFALHVWPGMEPDRVAIAPGPLMAGVNHLEVAFTGSGGHGAYPHLTADTVMAAASFVSSVQGVLGRRIDPLKSYVVTFGSIHGGSAPNIIPDRVSVEGTMRWYDKAVGEEIGRAIEETCGAVAKIHRAGFEFAIDEGYIPVSNDSSVTLRLGEALRNVIGADRVCAALPTMGAEDMGFMLDRVPGCYMHLGAGTSGPGAKPLHCGGFYPEDACLETGIAAMLTALWAFGAGR